MFRWLVPVCLAGVAAGAAKCGDAMGLNQWGVDNFYFNTSVIFSTPAHQIAWGHVGFELENPALGYTSSCEASSQQLYDFFYGNIVYPCKGPSGQETALFSFSRPNNTLTVHQKWECEDGDGDGGNGAATKRGYLAGDGAAMVDAGCRTDKYTNPDWKPNQIYSSTVVACGPASAHVAMKIVRQPQ